MKTLLLVAALFSFNAVAGEQQLGVIVSGAGADTTNGTTATPFVIPAGSKLTVWCTAAAAICTDQTAACVAPGSATTGAGVSITGSYNFPTSTSGSSSAPTITVTSKTSSIVRIVGTAAVNCTVFARNGNE